MVRAASVHYRAMLSESFNAEGAALPKQSPPRPSGRGHLPNTRAVPTLRAVILYYIHGDSVRSMSGGPDFATILSINPLAPNATLPPAQSQRVMLWSGWCGDAIFERDFRTWTPDAWQRLDQFLRLAEGEAAGSVSRDNHRICLRPHPRHILADPQSCLSFLKRYEGRPVELVLDAAGFLTRSMLPRAEEHIFRALDALADHPQVPALVIANVEPAPGDDDLLQPVPVDRGLLPAALIRLIASRATDKPVILFGDDPAAQARFLSAPG